MPRVDRVVFIFMALTLASIALFGIYSTGLEVGAKNPMHYIKTVEIEKVIGWCMIAGMEELEEVGVARETLKENLPEIREECEDRWLAFSKRWERRETK